MSLLARDLDYFLAICEARNLARAGDALDVSQPALTRSLQRLEKHVGARLFVRAPRGVELTPIGAALQSRAEKARVLLDEAEREVAQLAAGKTGRLRIGAGHIPARLVARALFPQLVVERPAAQVQFHVAFNAELFERLDAGHLDFAVGGLVDTPPPSLVFRELLTTGMLVVVRSGHPLTRRTRPTLRDLARYRAAAPGAGVRARQVVEARMAELGIAMPPHAIESNAWDAILDAVAASDLYTLAPVHPGFLAAWSPNLVTIEIEDLEVTYRTGVVTRASGYLSPLALRAIELIERQVAKDTRPKPSRTGPGSNRGRRGAN